MIQPFALPPFFTYFLPCSDSRTALALAIEYKNANVAEYLASARRSDALPRLLHPSMPTVMNAVLLRVAAQLLFVIYRCGGGTGGGGREGFGSTGTRDKMTQIRVMRGSGLQQRALFRENTTEFLHCFILCSSGQRERSSLSAQLGVSASSLSAAAAAAAQSMCCCCCCCCCCCRKRSGAQKE